MAIRGLTLRQWKAIRDPSHSFAKRCVTTLAPFGGFTNKIIGHLREDWIEWRDEFVRIEVPASAPCNDFKSKSSKGSHSGQPPIIEPRTEPCSYCKESSDNRFERKFRGFDDRDPSRYTVILHREIAEPAVNLLEMVFKKYDRTEIAIHPRNLDEASRQLCESIETQITDPNTTTLLRTGPVIYAHFGLELDEIAELSLYSKSSCKDIIRSTPGVNLDQTSTVGFLRSINEIEPATASEIGNKTNMTKQNAVRRLRRLKEESRVVAEDGHKGPPKATWETTNQWQEPFYCEECGYESYSLAGFNGHKSRTH